MSKQQQNNNQKTFGPNPFDKPVNIEENLAAKGFMDMCANLVHMAYALQAEAAAVPRTGNFEKDKEMLESKFLGKYKILEEKFPGLFRGALFGLLGNGQVADVMQAFTSSQCDPRLVYSNMVRVQDNWMAPARQYESMNKSKQESRVNQVNDGSE
jgi:hypothetical protein